MRNIDPIVVNGFGRGGTNIAMNLLLSHPSCAMPSGELNKVFKGGALGEGGAKKVYKKVFYDTPIKLFAGDIFDRFCVTNRKNITNFLKCYIDMVLWIEKQRARHEGHNKWKSDTEIYKKVELKNARLTLKAHNGLVGLNDLFREMYPSVRFVAIVRDGYAVCESLIRRGWLADEAALLYDKVGRQILSNMQKQDYFLINFEDVLVDPLGSIEKIYSHCDLDSKSCGKFRLQHKSVASDASNHSVLHGEYDRQLEWFDREGLQNYFKVDVNKNQIQRLSLEQIATIDRIAGKTISRLKNVR